MKLHSEDINRENLQGTSSTQPIRTWA